MSTSVCVIVRLLKTLENFIWLNTIVCQRKVGDTGSSDRCILSQLTNALL